MVEKYIGKEGRRERGKEKEGKEEFAAALSF